MKQEGGATKGNDNEDQDGEAWSGEEGEWNGEEGEWNGEEGNWDDGAWDEGDDGEEGPAADEKHIKSDAVNEFVDAGTKVGADKKRKKQTKTKKHQAQLNADNAQDEKADLERDNKGKHESETKNKQQKVLKLKRKQKGTTMPAQEKPTEVSKDEDAFKPEDIAIVEAKVEEHQSNSCAGKGKQVGKLKRKKHQASKVQTVATPVELKKESDDNKEEKDDNKEEKDDSSIMSSAECKHDETNDVNAGDEESSKASEWAAWSRMANPEDSGTQEMGKYSDVNSEEEPEDLLGAAIARFDDSDCSLSPPPQAPPKAANSLQQKRKNPNLQAIGEPPKKLSQVAEVKHAESAGDKNAEAAGPTPSRKKLHGKTTPKTSSLATPRTQAASPPETTEVAKMSVKESKEAYKAARDEFTGTEAQWRTSAERTAIMLEIDVVILSIIYIQ